MDSNHDIVPTLRMMDGVYTGLAADEIERLRARVALLERRADTSLIPGAVPTHRCKVCGAYWRKWDVDGETSWNLNSRGCGKCCDNALMGDQIEALVPNAKVGGDEREAFEAAYHEVFPARPLLIPSVLSRDGDNYQHPNVDGCWKLWRKARAALSADAGEDKRDAERYRWLRGEGFERPAQLWVTVLYEGRPIVHSDLDAAIDAAIAAKAKGEAK